MITPMTAAAVREAASTPLGRDRQNARRSRPATSEVSAKNRNVWNVNVCNRPASQASPKRCQPIASSPASELEPNVFSVSATVLEGAVARRW